MNHRPLFFRVLEGVSFSLAPLSFVLFFTFQKGLFMGGCFLFLIAALLFRKKDRGDQASFLREDRRRGVAWRLGRESFALRLLRRFFGCVADAAGPFNAGAYFLGCLSFAGAVSFCVFGFLQLSGVL
jgi:hypothetical protein